MNTLRFYLLFLALLALLFGSCEKEAAPKKPFRVGIINPTPTLNKLVEGIKAGVIEQGYKEGVDVEFIYEGPISSSAAVIQKAKEMTNANVDLIVGITTLVATRVKQAMADTEAPLVFTLVTDPVASGLVKSMREPGYNISGVKAFPIGMKGLEWLKKTVPKMKYLYVPFNPDDRGMIAILKDLKISAQILNVELIIVEVKTKAEVEAALQNIPLHADAVWELGSGFWAPYLKMFIQYPIKRKIPLVGASQNWAERGALMAFGTRDLSLGKQTSRYITKVMEGIPLRAIPVELSEGFLYLNLKTAKTIGITIPKEVLNQAELIVR